LSEQTLVERYGGSRAPMREAIQKLEARNLVVRVPHAGARVVSLSLSELRDIYEVRLELESMACRLAAQRMSDAEIAELYGLLAEHEASIAAEQGQSYYQKAGDLDFHYRIIKGSQNSRLHQMLCGELYHLVRMYRYQTSTSAKRPLQALLEHQRIVEAIAARDAELAELLMRRHIQASLTNLETRLAEEEGRL
jgi:DNA-binding GntR family transcriptional regulator